jgi:tetratricopeptide (TPR) repeat protein
MCDLDKRTGTRLFAVLALATLLALPALGQDVRLRIAPDLLIPLADNDVYGFGGGASLSFDMDLFGFLAPYLGTDARFITPAADYDGSLFIASGGGGLGFFAFPLPRLKLGLSGGSGIYLGSYTNGNESTAFGNIFWKAGAELGFRLSPGLTISAGASYIDYMTRSDYLYKGISIAILADMGFGSRTAEGRAVLQSAESVAVLPIRATEYAAKSFGTAVIRNAESAEIRNVEVWFHADGYTSGPLLCGRVAYLPKGSTATVPLVASFSDQVMTITENVRVRGEIRIIYELLGEARSARAETTVSLLHRNALSWEDPEILASFVSPNDPAVLDSSKFIAGVVRSRARQELDSNLQYALGIFEGFRLSGIAWAADPQTPYARTRQTASAVDYVQYPHQTLAYRSGDSDEIAVLYAAGLESVGVPAALLPLDNEVIAAFRMSRNESTTRGTFTDAGDFMFIDGEAWVPIRVSMLREGFLRAWSEGAKLVRETQGARDRFFRLSDAWQRYPPAGVPDIPASIQKPQEAQVRAAFDNVVSLVIAKEVLPRAERMKVGFGSDGGTGRQRNSLGILYARYGLYPEALAEFQAAAALGNEATTINIGNIAFLMGDYQTASAWFEKAMEGNFSNTGAVIGLARSLYELDRYDEADRMFRRAVLLLPELADRYGYLSARLSGSASRASAVMDRSGDMMWDE